MTTLLIIIHVAVCLFMVVIVLLQHGKGADIGATFGGSSQSLFGSEGPVPLMNKVTTGAAVIFMLTSISLAYISSHQGMGSVMQEYNAPAPPPPAAETKNTSEPAPAATEPVPVQGTEEPAPAEFPAEQAPQAAKGTEQAAPPAAKGAEQAAKAAGGQQQAPEKKN